MTEQQALHTDPPARPGATGDDGFTGSGGFTGDDGSGRPDGSQGSFGSGGFVGRERELAQLRAEIDRPGLGAAEPTAARVLLVAGRPGTGRTALALRFADEVAHRYPDGRHFLRLTTSDGAPVPPDEAARALRGALHSGPVPAAVPRPPAAGPHAPAPGRVAAGPGTPDAPAPGRAGSGGGRPDAPGRAGGGAPGASQVPGSAPGRAAAGASGRRVLLVLDDVAHAAQLAALLPASSGSLVVATSSGPLSAVADVRPCTLGGLDTPAAVELLSQVIGATRVTCDPRGAESLVQELAGHPTALRLVAAWLAARPRLSVADAANRLRAVSPTPFVRPRPPSDTPGAGEAADRPAAAPGTAGAGGSPGTTGAAGTPGVPVPVPPPAAGASGGAVEPPPVAAGELVRAFRLVYGELPAAAARILRLLVLAPAGFVDAQGASALAGCSVEAAQGTLDDFVRGGLLSGGGRRYAVPGCLEPMLAALLAATDRPADVRLARARLLERTVRLLQSCRAALAGEPVEEGLPRGLRFASAPAAADWLASRLTALSAAARMAVGDGELDTLARRLIAAMVRALAAFPGGDAMAAERYELHSLVLGVALRRGLLPEQAAALINLGDLDARAGRTDRALARYRDALAAARGCDDTQAEGRALEALGGTYLERRDPARACDWYVRALALRQARGELAHQARLHGRLGSLLAYDGRFGPALREWRAAANVYKRLGDLPGQARALAEAARVQEHAGRPEDAVRSCRDALYWARQAGERRLEAALMLRLADAYDRLGDPDSARAQREAVRRRSGPREQASGPAAPTPGLADSSVSGVRGQAEGAVSGVRDPAADRAPVASADAADSAPGAPDQAAETAPAASEQAAGTASAG